MREGAETDLVVLEPEICVQENVASKKNPADPPEGKVRRYNLVIPGGLYVEVEKLAKERGMKVIEMFRWLIKVGLLIDKILQSDDAELLIKEGEDIHKVLLV